MSRIVKRAFTLIELLVVIAIIAILAAILFPVFAQARAQARAISCVSNVKQFSLGILMYAQDYDESIPAMLNNDKCKGQLPGWGNPGTNPTETNTMFEGVVQPYIKNRQVLYCPEAGKTNWASVIPQSYAAGVPYVAALDQNGVYEGAFCQMAVNMLLTEYGVNATNTCGTPGGSASPGANTLSSWTRPAQLILVTGDSVWGEGINGDASPQSALGNTAVWPSYDSQSSSCHNWGGYALNADPGWIWYLHKAASRSGHFADAANTKFDQGINSGFGNVAFADGHVKAMRHNEMERCDFNTSVNLWAWTYWDPRY